LFSNGARSRFPEDLDFTIDTTPIRSIIVHLFEKVDLSTILARDASDL
jgi:hypothetical protein